MAGFIINAIMRQVAGREGRGSGRRRGSGRSRGSDRGAPRSVAIPFKHAPRSRSGNRLA